MTITYKINGVTLTNRVRLMEEGEGFVTAAERGAVGTGGVMIDDDDATLTINGWQSFTVDDDEAFPYSRVFTGFIVERNIGRNARYRTSTARVHDCSILDVNAYLHLHVLRANAAKRAAETDVARVAWLLTSEALSSLVYDRGLVSTANAGSYLESDTRRRFADDVMSELAPSAVKNFFVYQDNATATPGLFYDRDTSTAYSSTLRISNVASDVDNVVTFAPSIDATMQRQPNDQYGGVSYGWRGDPIYVQSATTIAAMGILRDAVYDTDRVGLLATAQQTSKDWLNVRATEADFITVSLILPSARINDIYAGQRIQVKFSHIPGYTSFTYTRIRRRAVKPVAPQFWEMRLELWVPAVPVSDAGVISSSGGSGTIFDEFDRERTFALSLDGWGTSTDGHSWVEGNAAAIGDYGAVVSAIYGVSAGMIIQPGGSFIDLPHPYVNDAAGDWSGDFTMRARVSRNASNCEYLKFAALDGNVLVAGAGFILSLMFQSDAVTIVGGASGSASFAFNPFVTGTPSVGSSWYLVKWEYRSSDGVSRVKVWNSGSGEPSAWTVTIAGTSGLSHDYFQVWTSFSTTSGSTVLIDYIDFSDEASPQSGDLISENLGFGDGATVAYTTGHPFADGTLMVFVDRLDQTGAVIGQNGQTGAFSLSFAPLSSELVEVTYRGR